MACQPVGPKEPLFAYEVLAIPENFPPVEFPDDNPFTLEGWQLGKYLFFDQRMSADGSVSCASCHQPHLAFSDGLSVSQGVAQRLGERNAPESVLRPASPN